MVAVCASSYGVTNMWGCSGYTAEAQAVVGKGREKQKPMFVIYYNQRMGDTAQIEVYL